MSEGRDRSRAVRVSRCAPADRGARRSPGESISARTEIWAEPQARADRPWYRHVRDCASRRTCDWVRRASLLDESTAEVKRMYVEPELRKRGVAKEILDHLEGVASTLGAHRLVLETGIYQEEAIGLYLRAGVKQVDCWGEYATAPTSVCYQKTL